MVDAAGDNFPAGAPGVAAFPGVSAGAGVAFWFLTLVLVLRRYEGKLRRDVLSRVVRALGVALFFMGVWSAIGLACSLARARM